MSDKTRFLWLKSVVDFDAVHGAYLPSTEVLFRPESSRIWSPPRYEEVIRRDTGGGDSSW